MLKHSRALAYILLATVTVTTFCLAVKGAFIWDDDHLIVNNVYIRDWRYFGHNLTTSFWNLSLSAEDQQTNDLVHRRGNVYFRPIVTLSYMVDYSFYGLNAWGYHLTNLLFHLAAVLLALRVMLMLFPDKPLLSALALCLFAIHPSRSESVVWIAGRTDLMMGMFFFLALACFFQLIEKDRSEKKPLLAIVSVMSYLCSLLCKETALAFPVLVVLMPFCFGNFVERKDPWRRYIQLVVWLLTIGFVLLRMISGRHTALAQDAPTSSIYSWAMVVLETVGRLIYRIFNPYEPSMQVGAYYDILGPNWNFVGVGGASIVFLSIALIWSWIRARNVFAFLLFFLSTLALVVNIIPLKLSVITADRFLYLPLFGLSGLLMIAFVSMSLSIRRLAVIVFCFLCATWMPMNILRTLDFSDPLRFWHAEAIACPLSPVPKSHLAHLLFSQGRTAQSEKWLWGAYNNAKSLGLTDDLYSMQIALLEIRLTTVTDFQRDDLRAVATFLSNVVEVAEGKKTEAKLNWKNLQFVLRAKSAATAQYLQLRLPTLWSMLAVLDSRLEEDRLAMELMEKIRTRTPLKASQLRNYALIVARAGDSEKLKNVMENFRRVAPANGSNRMFEGTIKHADLLWQQIRSEQDELIRLRKEIELFNVLQAPVRMVKLIEHALEKDPNDRSMWTSLIVTLNQYQQTDQARDALARAKQRFGNEPGLAQLEAKIFAKPN